MIASRWVWGLLGSAVMFSGSGIATAQRLPPSPRLLAQTTQKTEADVLFDEGRVLYRLGTVEGYQEAIIKFQQALLLYRILETRQREAYSLGWIGNIHDRLGNKKEALNYYTQNLPLYQELGDQKEEASTLNNIGLVYSNLGEQQQALDYYEQALPLWRAVDDRSGEATTLSNIGLVYSNLGEQQQALDYYQQALAIDRILGERRSEAITLNNIGLVYSDLGEQQQALDYYEQALPLFQAVNDRSEKANTLNNIGGVYLDLGEREKALDYFQQALPLRRAVGDRSGEAITLNNIGGVYNALGEKQKALEYYKQALPLLQAVGNRPSEANTFNNIGTVYGALGEQQEALDYYQQALPLWRAVDDRRGEATTLNNIGWVYSALGKKKKALDYFQQALPLSRAVGDQTNESRLLNNIGGVYSALGEKQQALDYYQQALPLWRAVGDRNGEALTFNNLGFLLKEEQPELAIIFYKQSVNIYGTLRKDIEQLDSEIQQTYLSTIEYTYRNLADLLLQENRVFEAQRVLDLLKVQELDDYFRNVRQAVDSAPEDVLIQKERPYLALQEARNNQILTLSTERLTLLARKESGSLSRADRNRFAEIEIELGELSENFYEFINSPEVQDILATLKINLREYDETVDIAQSSQLRSELADIKEFGENAALLYPLILGDRLEVIVITADAEPLRFTKYISSTELNQLIIEASATLKNKTTDYQALQQLHEYLIEPFEAELQNFGIENIIYAPDGALRYIPLAALYDGEKWLIEKYRTTNITALSLTSFADKPKKVVDILGAAFPATKQTISVDTAVNTRDFNFSGLPAATTEIEGIASVFPVEKRLAGDFGKNIYSEFNLYSVIHLATHAKFLPGTPEDSFIVFGNGEYTNLKEIGEKWKFTEDQLVVLSACETGLGTDFTELNAENNGIEIVGLAYQMQRKGAQSTIASLWQVQDDSTQVLMTEFYRQLRQSNISKAEALRIAQASLTQNPKYAHPYHWASFVMIGNGL